MGMYYSDESRENDDHALPDIEVFYVEIGYDDSIDRESVACGEPGWYWWSCFPGCLPDSDPIGPFNSEEEALADARGY